MTLTARPTLTSLGYVRGYLLDFVFPTVLPGVPAFYGNPGRDIPPRFVATVIPPQGTEVTQEWQGQSYQRPHSVGESYQTDIVLWSFIGDQDPAAQRAVTEDVFGMFDLLATYLRANPGLGSDATGVVISTPANCRVARYTQHDYWLQEGRAAGLVVSLSIETRV